MKFIAWTMQTEVFRPFIGTHTHTESPPERNSCKAGIIIEYARAIGSAA